MRKICVINQKGGVAKTTTVVNIASGLSRQDKKVLILDLDAQGNSGTCLHAASTKDMFDLLIEGADIRECITHLGKNLDMITSKETLTKAELILVGEQNREKMLCKKLKDLKDYDYVIMDCPPSLGLLNQNAMLYADEAIIPVSTDILGYEALKKIIRAITTLNHVFDHGLIISKIVPTLYDQRLTLCREILDKIRSEYYELVAEPIRINSKLKEAPRSGKSIFSYDPFSRGAEDYKRLVQVIMQDEQRFIDLAQTKQKMVKIRAEISN